VPAIGTDWNFFNAWFYLAGLEILVCHQVPVQVFVMKIGMILPRIESNDEHLLLRR